MPLIEFTDCGLYCRQADMYIDPWKPVDKALVTHAHSDHARWGMKRYLAHRLSVPILQHRLGADIRAEGIEYGTVITVNGVRISLHPAGHILGSAQARFEYRGETWTASGDYKPGDDGFSGVFEPVKCQHFVTESTFGLPIYKWKPQAEVVEEINQWWRENRDAGITSVIGAYSLGKAQRLIQTLDHGIGKIYTHGAIEAINGIIRSNGTDLKPTVQVMPDTSKEETTGAMVIAPSSALGSTWMRRFVPYSTAMASGWMMLRGTRRRMNVDRGFALSDHADWDGLNASIRETGAENIYVTHGYTTAFARWLHENGYRAEVVKTDFGEQEEG